MSFIFCLFWYYEITISLPLFPNIFCYFPWIISWSCFYWKTVPPGRKVNNIILSRRYICHQFQNWESQKFMLNWCNILFQAKIQQRHFPNLQGDRQSQKWPTKSQHILPWKASLITPCWRERASPFLCSLCWERMYLLCPPPLAGLGSVSTSPSPNPLDRVVRSWVKITQG